MPLSEHPMNELQTKLATALSEHRAQAIELARAPGLTGISRTKGIRTLEAVLDDVARNVAFVVTDDNDAFRTFIYFATNPYATKGA